MPAKSVCPECVVIGLDDTDMPGTQGTGKLARMLAEQYRRQGVGVACGVTRHQLYEGPGVPRTSHNSAAAIVLSNADPARALTIGVAFLGRHAARGSDPGLAVMSDRLTEPALEFARRTQCELVEQAEARAVAQSFGITLVGLAGTEDGVIGALAAAALRSDGRDGRFIDLPGIRELHGRMTVADILTRSAAAAVIDQETGLPLERSQVVETEDWIRPRVIDHLPIVVARRKGGDWIHADTRPAAR